MPATKITDLLPIPPGIRQPHPYQVLGLEDGEQDSAVIASALQSAISRLKDAKSQTDPSLWKKAARLVKGAQDVLSDPERKAKLDARFGIISRDALAAAQASPADALAAFLPPADPLSSANDPLAAVLPSTNPLAPTEVSAEDPVPSSGSPRPANAATSEAVEAPLNSMPPGLFGTPPSSDDSPQLLPSMPVVAKVPRPRRKRSNVGAVLFFTFAFGTFGAIGALVYFLIFSGGQVAITKSEGMISISAQPPSASGSTIVSQPRPVAPTPAQRPRDSIIGKLDPGALPPGLKGQPSGLTSSLDSEFGGDSQANGSMPMKSLGMSDRTSASLPSNDVPPMVSDDSPAMEPAIEPAMKPLTDDLIAQADQSLERVRQLIQSANWKEMKPAAEAALAQRMSADQMNEAKALFEVADLASYYRGGIEKAVAGLNIGNDFEVTEDFRVIVVETGPDLLVVRFNAKNRSFVFDELPWSLAHKLASFSMPDDPTTEAAKAVYQAISPNANEAYRDQALKWLTDIQGEVEGADPERLGETIRNLFGES